MFTEAQFTTALEAVVARKGGDYTYPRIDQSPSYYMPGPSGYTPRYALANGEGACMIGAALIEMGVPRRLFADTATPAQFLSCFSDPIVGKAARVAQMHQDMNRPWGEALAMYHAALRIMRGTGSIVPSWSVYEQAHLEVVGKSPKPRNSVTHPSLPSIETLASLTASLNALTASFASVTNAAGKVCVTFPTASTAPQYITEPTALAVSKKEHALVA